MKALDNLGEADETLVIFLSDNGGIDERYGFKNLPRPNPARPRFEPDLREYDNAPLRAGKGSCYEGGVRVPMIVRWPGRAKTGAVVHTPVHAVDLLPTFFEAAGAAVPEEVEIDGRSLVRLLTEGRDKSLADRPIFQYYPFYDLRWGLTPCATVRRGRFKLIEFFGDRVDDEGRYAPGHRLELYDLHDDPGEAENLAETHPEVTARLHDTLHAWMEATDAKPSTRNAHHDPARAFVETRDKPPWLERRPPQK